MKRRAENGELRMKNGIRLVFRLTFVLLLWLVVSCTAKKKLVSPMAHAADYAWMSAKFNGELSTENGGAAVSPQLSSFSFTGSLRMRRDSTVWLSASAFLGVENARLLVTTDSVYMVNRVNQTYVAETLEKTCQSASLSPMTVHELQALLLGDGTSDHVEIQWGPYLAKIKYDDIQWDEPTTFPMKINKKYERVKL